MDVEASRAIRQAEVGAAKSMIERTEARFDIKPERLAADTAYGSGANLNWLVNDKKIAPHIPVIDKSKRDDGTFSREDRRIHRRAPHHHRSHGRRDAEEASRGPGDGWRRHGLLKKISPVFAEPDAAHPLTRTRGPKARG
jgi:hypothetical protein